MLKPDDFLLFVAPFILLVFGLAIVGAYHAPGLVKAAFRPKVPPEAPPRVVVRLVDFPDRTSRPAA